MIGINLDGVSSGFEPIPVGAYEVIVSDCAEIISSVKGTPGINFTYIVQEGEYAGRKIFDTCWISEKALFRIKNVLESLGMEIPAGQFELNPDDCIGKYAIVSVDIETYTANSGEEKEKNVVKGIAKFVEKTRRGR